MRSISDFDSRLTYFVMLGFSYAALRRMQCRKTAQGRCTIVMICIYDCIDGMGLSLSLERHRDSREFVWKLSMAPCIVRYDFNATLPILQ